MLFGWAVVFAILLGQGTAPTSKRATAHVWMDYEARPTPLNLDLKAPPLEFKSVEMLGPDLRIVSRVSGRDNF